MVDASRPAELEPLAVGFDHRGRQLAGRQSGHISVAAAVVPQALGHRGPRANFVALPPTAPGMGDTVPLARPSSMLEVKHAQLRQHELQHIAKGLGKAPRRTGDSFEDDLVFQDLEDLEDNVVEDEALSGGDLATGIAEENVSKVVVPQGNLSSAPDNHGQELGQIGDTPCPEDAREWDLDSAEGKECIEAAKRLFKDMPEELVRWSPDLIEHLDASPLIIPEVHNAWRAGIRENAFGTEVPSGQKKAALDYPMFAYVVRAFPHDSDADDLAKVQRAMRMLEEDDPNNPIDIETISLVRAFASGSLWNNQDLDPHVSTSMFSTITRKLARKLKARYVEIGKLLKAKNKVQYEQLLANVYYYFEEDLQDQDDEFEHVGMALKHGDPDEFYVLLASIQQRDLGEVVRSQGKRNDVEISSREHAPPSTFQTPVVEDQASQLADAHPVELCDVLVPLGKLCWKTQSSFTISFQCADDKKAITCLSSDTSQENWEELATARLVGNLDTNSAILTELPPAGPFDIAVSSQKHQGYVVSGNLKDSKLDSTRITLKGPDSGDGSYAHEFIYEHC